MNSVSIERSIAEITANKNFSSRLPAPDDVVYAGIVEAVNLLLSEVEMRDKQLREKIAELGDARDDAQTSNLLLKRVKEDLRSRGAQLDSALKKAAAASSAKSMFLANMSHEIRTPMNGILGMAELLNRSELNPKQRQQVGTIVHSGRALLTIINDILDFSKIESGKYELDPHPFDLKMCLGDIVELLTPTATRKSLKISLDFAPGLPKHYVGDAGRIRQVVMNLAGNAVKFTDSGSVTLRVSGDCVDDNAALLIEIIDTGIGIPEDKLADVFEKFSMVDQTGTRQHEGTGLGLSICQLLAERMKGSITAESTFGAGSKFSFRFVLPVHHKAAAAPEVLSGLSGKAIALVGSQDDTVAARQALSQAGCSVVEFANLAGLAQLAAGFHAVVVASVSTPDSLRRDIADFRNAKPSVNSPIVVVVRNGAPGDGHDVSHAGAQGYLSGAFEHSALIQMIQLVLTPAAEQADGAPKAAAAPLVTRHTLAEVLAVEEPVSTAAPTQEKQRYKVLIVDDSMVNQEIAKEFLEDLECDVEMANNGVEAVSATEQTCYDLVLMDCQMPLMDGFAATAAIRSRQAAATSSGVPIIALTANAFASDREKCLASGMSDFLSKPFLPMEFDTVVMKWLDAGRAAKAA